MMFTMNRFFAVMTLAPLAVWLGCFLGAIMLDRLYGCNVFEGSVATCDFHGREAGRTAAILGVLTTSGAYIFGPFTLISGLAWGMFTLIRRLRLRARR